jgi:hypothetical protein
LTTPELKKAKTATQGSECIIRTKQNKETGNKIKKR